MVSITVVRGKPVIGRGEVDDLTAPFNFNLPGTLDIFAWWLRKWRVHRYCIYVYCSRGSSAIAFPFQLSIGAGGK